MSHMRRSTDGARSGGQRDSVLGMWPRVSAAVVVALSPRRLAASTADRPPSRVQETADRGGLCAGRDASDELLALAAIPFGFRGEPSAIRLRVGEVSTGASRVIPPLAPDKRGPDLMSDELWRATAMVEPESYCVPDIFPRYHDSSVQVTSAGVPSRGNWSRECGKRGGPAICRPSGSPAGSTRAQTEARLRASRR